MTNTNKDELPLYLEERKWKRKNIELKWKRESEESEKNE